MKSVIDLTPEQWERLNTIARERCMTVSQLLEALVNQALTENAPEDWEDQKRRALSVVGQFRGAPDLSQNHDEYWE
jgi:macrodomain Ter protein organizer (MatP/YcbG family)